MTRIYIPPPKAYFEKKGSKGLASVRIFYTGFPANAIKAMEKAVSILETILPSDTRLTIQTTWTKLEENDVLGQSVITGFAKGEDINAFKPNAYYPASLAEKIAGIDLNGDADGDLQLTINSSINWYLGVDGKTPTNRYDLVTVALHEIIHGLGFYDSMSSDETLGSYGFRDTPMIYDTFIEDQSNRKLIDTLRFENPSAGLHTAITGGNLFFDGPLTRNYTAGARVMVYAPSTWDAGSSVSHLDEDLTLQINALMTPFIDRGEAIHDPGNLTLSILGDLGWINTRIIHNKPRDSEELLDEIEISVAIDSDTIYNRNRVGLVYTYNNFSSSDTIYLTSQAQDNNFRVILPIPFYESSLRYYFFAEDVFRRHFRSPSTGALNPYRIYIGTDTVKPLTIHSPIEYYLESIDTIRFTATVTDNIGVDTVYAEYRINGGISSFIGLMRDTGDVFTAYLNARQLSLNGGDNIQYRIISRDVSSQQNTRLLPGNGFYTFRIEGLGSPVTSYFTDFSNAANDFFNIGFEIAQPAGFSGPALHSEHPYVSSRTDSNLEFTAMLRNPVIIDESGLIITFRELVLVEPGEPGSLFGSPDFYDYVVIETSKDFGKTWFNLGNGYDSRYIPAWDSAYSSNLDEEGNSLFIGTETLMKEHTLFPDNSESVSIGDTLLFRFRLFSDPFANGWGWIIDDLKINQLVDNIVKVKNDTYKVFPNPGKGIINIHSNDILSGKPVNFRVYNTAGVCVLDDYIESSESTIDISRFPSGLYIIKFYSGTGIGSVRYSLIK